MAKNKNNFDELVEKNDAMNAAYCLLEENEKFNLIKKSYEERREELQTIIRKYLKDETKFSFDSHQGKYKKCPARLLVTNVVQKKITWDIPKLKKKLSKDIIDKVIDKTYTINDFYGLVKYLKSCNVDPKIFKRFVDVEEKVINEQMDLLSDIGDIKKEDVAGCYSVKTNVGFIRVTENKINGKEDQEN